MKLCKGQRVFIVLDDLSSFPNIQDWIDFESLLTVRFGVLITPRNPEATRLIISLSTAACVSKLAN